MRNLTERDSFWEQLADYFAQFHLPPPQEDDIVHLREEMAIVLNEYGCLFRITYSGQYLEKEGLSLEPLHEGEFSGYGPLSHTRIRLYAGVEHVGVNDHDFRNLRHAFHRDGFTLLATPRDDCAYIPFEKNGKTVRLPLLIDVTDIRDTCKLDAGNESLKDALYRMAMTCAEVLRLKPSLKTQLHQAQMVLYDDLRVKCRAMLDASPDERAIKTTEFWSAMRLSTQEVLPDGTRKLSAGWKKPLKSHFAGFPDDVYESLLQAISADSESPTALAKPLDKKNIVAKGGDHYAVAIRDDPFHRAILCAAEPPEPPSEKPKITFNAHPWWV